VMIYVAISYRPTRNPERRRSQSHLLVLRYEIALTYHAANGLPV
jgi:hypothetical protein